jgi:hypothetical protein
VKARSVPSSWVPIWALLLGFAAYSWVLDNGFISDDLVFLDQSRDLGFLPDHLRSAPSAFRLTADFWFAGIQRLFDYHPPWFYVFSIVLHVSNALMLRSVLLRRGADRSVATLASLLFVVIQNPAEAVAWLSAVNELLVAFFVLASLRAALGSRYGFCLAFYGAALISKESGMVTIFLLLLLLLTRPERQQPPPKWFWYVLAVITTAYLIWFVMLMQTNPLIQARFYSLRPTAILVLAYSLHKLAFPWIYLALALGLPAIYRPAAKRERRELAVTAVWLLPDGATHSGFAQQTALLGVRDRICSRQHRVPVGGQRPAVRHSGKDDSRPCGYSSRSAARLRHS